MIYSIQHWEVNLLQDLEVNVGYGRGSEKRHKGQSICVPSLEVDILWFNKKTNNSIHFALIELAFGFIPVYVLLQFTKKSYSISER